MVINRALKLVLLLFVAAGLTITNALAVGSTLKPASLYKDNADGSRTLFGHVPHKELATAKFQSHAKPDEILKLSVILSFRPGLDELIKNLYDPKSPVYHHFLTPEQFNQQFSPSSIDTQAVLGYFQSKGGQYGGLSFEGQSPNGLVLKFEAQASTVEKLFRLHINHYLDSQGKKFFAPDADPTIDIELVNRVKGIAGLDNLNRIVPLSHRQTKKSKLSANFGAGPLGYVAPSDIIKAYNLTGVSSKGAGQSVALVEFDGYLASDINTYDSYFTLPTPYVPLQNVYIDGFDGTPTGNGGDQEVTLDIEILTAIAPALNNIYVYEAMNDGYSWIDEWNKIAHDNLAKIISCSWGQAEQFSPTAAFDNAITQQMAVQGQEVFAASGDWGADSDGEGPSVLELPAQHYVTGVGISLLSVNSDGSYLGEQASGASGGGISIEQTIPDYQVGMISTASQGSTTMRNVPDLAFTADPSTAYSFFIEGQWGGWWGSSIASPIWAGFNALVNQGLVNSGQTTLGFINPILYAIAQGTNYTQDFHDITSGNNGVYYAVTGYDDVTGLGSFNGLNLYNDLILAPKLNVEGQDSAVVLTWQAIDTGILSYEVKRATTKSGPYTIIASGITNQTYTDTLVTNGIKYYYQITEVKATGESLTSLPVSTVAGTPRIIYAAASSGGTINPSGTISVPLTTLSKTFVVTSNTGYGISQILIDGQAITVPSYSASFTYTFTDFTTAHSISASFVIPPQFTINASIDGSGGTISPSGTVTVTGGQSPSFAITAAQGYIVGEIVIDGSPAFLALSQTYTYTFNYINANHTIKAYFQVADFPITSSIDNGCTIYPAERNFFNYGSSQTYTMQAVSANYSLYGIIVDGQPTLFNPSVLSDSYTFTNITASHTIQALCSLPTNTITASVFYFTQPHGTISPSGSVIVPAAGSQTFTVTPNPGYGISLLGVDGSFVPTTSSYTFNFVSTSHSIEAYFIPAYTASAGPGGTITPSGVVNIIYGSPQTFTITPNSGYTVNQVLVNGQPVTTTSSPATPGTVTYTFSGVTTPQTISATFNPPLVTLLNGTLIDTLTQQPITDMLGSMSWNPAPVATGPGGEAELNPQQFPNFQMYNLAAGTYQLTFNLQGHIINYPLTIAANSPYNYSRLNIPVPIIKASASTGGTISPAGAYLIDQGGRQSFTFSPNTGYSISQLLIDGKSITPIRSSYTFTNVSSAHTISVIFTKRANSIPVPSSNSTS